ncbi:MAG: hypothetical protein ACYC8S_03065 [Minisyncoccota bacterium]
MQATQTQTKTTEPTIIVGVVISSLAVISLSLGAFLALQRNEIVALRNAKPVTISRAEHLTSLGRIGFSCSPFNDAGVTTCTEVLSGCRFKVTHVREKKIIFDLLYRPEAVAIALCPPQ